MKKSTFVLICIAISAVGFNIIPQLFIVPSNWPQPKYKFSGNPLTKETINLGRVLFYDPILSRNNTISCASCHSPYTAFTHIDHPLSHGIDDAIGTRNAPALMNLAWQKSFMWDGGINNLDMQSLFPITHPKEMDETMKNVVVKLQQSRPYRVLFYKAFKDSSITGEHTLKALSQFMLTLISSNAKYDSVMRHQAKFSSQELNGYQLFKRYCNGCHAEPLFTNMEFANNGLPIDTMLNDYGRMNITHLAIDSFKFKIPSLRNIEVTFPYMHDGRFNRLADVLKHYTSIKYPSATLAQELKKPLEITANDRVDIIAFLLTLTDKQFLSNKENKYLENIFYQSKRNH